MYPKGGTLSVPADASAERWTERTTSPHARCATSVPASMLCSVTLHVGSQPLRRSLYYAGLQPPSRRVAGSLDVVRRHLAVKPARHHDPARRREGHAARAAVARHLAQRPTRSDVV